MTQIPDYDRGYRDGLRAAVTWLAERAKTMNDGNARAVLNTAAFNLGSDASQGRISSKARGRPNPRVAELEALNAELRGRVEQFKARERARQASVVCPWDAMDDDRSDIPETEPCPVCGMLGTPGAEDTCLGGPRRARPATVTEGEG